MNQSKSLSFIKTLPGGPVIVLDVKSHLSSSNVCIPLSYRIAFVPLQNLIVKDLETQVHREVLDFFSCVYFVNTDYVSVFLK